MLQPGQWEPFNLQRLNQVLRDHGRGNPAYRPECPPYAVFDWDNTCVFLDVEEACFAYQLLHLRLGAEPEQLRQALRTGVPPGPLHESFKNQAGQLVDGHDVIDDIADSYLVLHRQRTSQSLQELQKSSHYWAFISKFRYLYEALDATYHQPVSYPWITYRFVAMTEGEVRQLAVDAVRWQLGEAIEERVWTCPDELPGRSGVVTIRWKSGLRLLPEIQDLMSCLRSHGFEVWVCTASFVDVIKEIASNPEFGYGVAPDQVIGMELERDHSGRIQSQLRAGFAVTFGAGKTQAIRERIVARLGCGPVLIAGDSEGDQDMMSDFDPAAVLIINLAKPFASKIGELSRLAVASHGLPQARFLLQGRDDESGRLVPTQRYFPSGNREGILTRF